MTEELKYMSCADFQAQLPELIGAGETISDHPHIQNCELCRALLAELETIAEAARQLFPIVEPPDELWEHIESAINHSPGRTVAKAHSVSIEPKSLLAEIVGASAGGPVAVNSSHHQSADGVGDGLRVVARSAEDGIIEAVEGTAPGHFVLAVQWHPERSVNEGTEVAEPAKAIFRAFVEAAQAKHGELIRAVAPACR